MPDYHNASFPPSADWDERLSDIACTELTPVEKLHENPWFSVCNRGGYFTVEYHLRQVIVLPVVSNDSVAMVRVKRPVINDLSLELPAGAVEEDESPVAAAARELDEEAGIAISDSDRYIPMPPLAVSPTRMPSLVYVFQVDITEREFLERKSHDEEIYCVERVYLQDLAQMMASGEIYVAVPLAILGIFLASRN